MPNFALLKFNLLTNLIVVSLYALFFAFVSVFASSAVIGWFVVLLIVGGTIYLTVTSRWLHSLYFWIESENIPLFAKLTKLVVIFLQAFASLVNLWRGIFWEELFYLTLTGLVISSASFFYEQHVLVD